MRKLLAILLFVFAFNSAKCDVIPYWLNHYALIGYSFEGIISYEKLIDYNTTWNYWAGGGIVGSALYLNEPAFGIEGAIEWRLYFKRDKFSGLNCSMYLGTSLMYNNQEKLNLGVLPGLKLTHKSLINGKVLVEPYVSLSFPISYNLTHTHPWMPFPVATIGLRVGMHKWIGKSKT